MTEPLKKKAKMEGKSEDTIDPSDRCEECLVKRGTIKCFRHDCRHYGSEDAECMDEEDDVLTGSKPHHTGLRCSDCLTKGNTYCWECKKFQCYTCTQLDKQHYDWSEEANLTRYMRTCSYCDKRVCHYFQQTCYRQCVWYERGHRMVACLSCLKKPDLLSAWTFCRACNDYHCNQADGYTKLSVNAFCPSCQNKDCDLEHGKDSEKLCFNLGGTKSDST